MFAVPNPNAVVPPRKRRRPALSCTECRRRKIKCDRNMPCNHCIASKNPECSYKDAHPAVANRRTTVSPNSSSGNMRSGAIEAPLRGPESIESIFNIADLEDGSSIHITSSPGLIDDTSSKDSYSSAVIPVDPRFAKINRQVLVDRVRKTSGSTPNVEDLEKADQMFGVNFSTFEDVIVQDGDSRNVLRTKVFTHSEGTPIQEMKGTLSKTRFFGQSHWMNCFEKFRKVALFRQISGKGKEDPAFNDIREALEKCKAMARAVKAQRPTKWHMNPNFKDYVPPREISDKLVEHYLRTAESMYRILHIPSFKQEYESYWADPQKASTMTVVQILLVMAIGTCFHQEEGNDELRSEAQQWVYSAQSWILGPFEKGRLNMSGIQLHCLLLLARQTCAVGGDLTWIAAGTALRTAFSMGFHRDPKHFPKIGIFQAEMRRRIWATVMEMTVQTSLDTGMPPLITFHDFDTASPANIDDEEISPDTTVMPKSKPINTYTRTSVQIILLKSLHTRLEISQRINDFRVEPTYEEIIRLGQEIAKSCNEAGRLVSSYPATSPRPTALQRNLLDILIRRYLLNVHRLFAVRSQADPRYYYSRKVCLDAALTIFFLSGLEDLPPNSPPGIVDDQTRLKIVGGGFFKEFSAHAGVIIVVELIMQLEEDLASGLPPSLASKAAREPMHRCVREMIDLAAERIKHGENNAKSHLFVCAAGAQIEAMVNGVPAEPLVTEAARNSAKTCLELLRARTKSQPATPGSVISVGSGSFGTGDMDMGFDLFMSDVNINFGETPDSWLFPGWDEGMQGGNW